MFRRLTEQRAEALITVDGRPVRAAAGESVSAALLLAGITAFRRNGRHGGERGPYCGMGVCFDCLVTIDGVPNRQACLVRVADGQRIETGRGRPNLAGAAEA